LSPAHRHERRRWGRDLARAAALCTALAAGDVVAGLVNHLADRAVLVLSSSLALLLAVAARIARPLRRGPGTGAASVPAAVRDAAEGAATEPGGLVPADGVRPAATSLWRMRTTVADVPGSLGRVCTALADLGVDIVTLQTHPLAQGAVDEFLLRAPAGLPDGALAFAVTGAGGADVWLERADAHDLVDTPTRMLTLATRTALDPAELPLALRELLGRCAITSDPRPEHRRGGAGADPGVGAWQDAGPRPASSAAAGDAADRAPETADALTDVLEDTVMRLRDPSGGTITVRRDHLPFTPTEFARARALVELDARLGVRTPEREDALTLPGGEETSVRRVGPQDRPAALALHERCSPATLAQRYHGPVGDADRYLAHLLSPRFGHSLAVETASGRLVALGHLLWDGDESEVALLVEDEWQGRGVGGALLRKLVETAAQTGRDSVYAVTRSSNTAMVAAMRALGLPLDYQVEEGTLVITAALPGAAREDRETHRPPRVASAADAEAAARRAVEALPWICGGSR
jgi:GNAT superfamily N-acetyltransferase